MSTHLRTKCTERVFNIFEKYVVRQTLHFSIKSSVKKWYANGEFCVDVTFEVTYHAMEKDKTPFFYGFHSGDVAEGPFLESHYASSDKSLRQLEARLNSFITNRIKIEMKKRNITV